jgi:N-acetylglucosamine-6-sulfatase
VASRLASREMGLRTRRYAFFGYSTGEGELYDLFTDPLELRSRYDDPAYASVRPRGLDQRTD